MSALLKPEDAEKIKNKVKSYAECLLWPAWCFESNEKENQAERSEELATGADVKGVPSPDGKLPQTKGFLDSLGDSIVKAVGSDKPGVTDNLKDTAKWVAIGIAVAGAFYIATKVT